MDGDGAALGLSALSPTIDFAEILRSQETLALRSDGDQPTGDAELTTEQQRLHDAATELESFMVYQMLSVMRKSMPKSEMFSGGYGEEVFESMLDQEYAMQMSKTGDMGLAQMIYDDMSKFL